MKKVKSIGTYFIALIASFQFFACNKGELLSPELLPKLSDYSIFIGNSSDLTPNIDYKLYDLSAQLFTDYAEKQRLIKVPIGTTMTATNDGLLDFPEGTIIVKTFYYYNDKRDTTKGKKIIETRLLVKTSGEWKAGTYRWDDAQNEAYLITAGLSKTVNWIDQKGVGRVINYQIPSNIDCKTCHNTSNVVMPIGPKVRNLNMEVIRNNTSQNQLTYLHNQGVLNSVDPSSFSTLPNYKDETLSLEQRARAYTEINCAHCHNSRSFAASVGLGFNYENTLEETKILDFKIEIINRTQSGGMPKIGTTIIDHDGVEILKNYINSL
jgi:uncharacterized repeat protein (TIGR03806 family)